MTRNVAWIHNIGRGDIATAGGKGANLGEMVQVGFPVPPAYVVTALAYRDFLQGTGLGEQVSAILKKVDPDNNRSLHEASDRIRKLFTQAKLPDDLRKELVEAYRSLSEGQDGGAFVAVRSSATAEDLPEASFAGQQETFLNVRGEDDLVRSVLKCWSSLFTPRAIFYRAKHRFEHDTVRIAVVVQRMVNAEKAGVMFTCHPTTGEDIVIVEGALGLGEGVVSGAVSPDNYLVTPKGELTQVNVASQENMFIRGADGKTAIVKVPADQREQRVLSDEELTRLAKVGKQVEKHYGAPQDIEWAFEGGELYMLQTRPVTTVKKKPGGEGGKAGSGGAGGATPGAADGAGGAGAGAAGGKGSPSGKQGAEEVTGGRQRGGAGAGADAGTGGGAQAKVLLKGLGAAPGIAAGRVVVLKDADELHKVQQGDILVTPMTMPDMVPAMKRAGAIVTDEGGMTCHAAIVSRELGVPCVVGTKRRDTSATKVLAGGMMVTVDGEKGLVFEGDVAPREETSEAPAGAGVAQAAAAPGPVASPTVASKPLTATQVKVNLSMPEAVDRALAVDPDGVGLLRIEHIVLAFDEDYAGLERSGRSEGGQPYPRPVHPAWAIANGLREKYVQFLFENFKRIVAPMAPRPVWIRTLDIPTDEMKKVRGGEDEPHEHNPMLGWRGVRRGLAQEELLLAEFEAIKRLHDEGLRNAGIMLPLVQHPEEVRRAKALMRRVGLDPQGSIDFGIMVEIPAAAIIVDLLIDEGLDFVSFGTNDLTQYTLAVDRNSPGVAPLYDEFHPAVARLIEQTIKTCAARGVQTSICGQAGSNPAFVEKLVQWGITSVSANIDALPRVREHVARVERKLILERARQGC